MLYYAVWPLGKLQTTIIELQDEWEALRAISAQPSLQPDVPCRSTTLDWPRLEAQARQEQAAQADNNPYGIDNEFWIGLQQRMGLQIKDNTGQKYIDGMHQSDEWLDLELLLKTLTEVGAQPLLLSRPINGTYFSALGVTPQARQTGYYDRLRQLAQRYGVPVVDFQDHDMDKYFSIDPTSHTSRLGWVYVDQTLDAFYHGTLR
jgi:poly-D-alanine transfer protein DltD